MARWNPPNNIGNNEHVGRRLFDEPMLIGAGDQRSFAGLLLSHFEETRDDEYSLDRLGQSSVDKKVVTYLRPRAAEAGSKFRKPKSFNGWAVAPARELIKPKKQPAIELIASPIDGEPLNDNMYHAHALKPGAVSSEYMAYHLRHLFVTYGKIESVSSEPDVGPMSLARLLTGIKKMVLSFFQRPKE